MRRTDWFIRWLGEWTVSAFLGVFLGFLIGVGCRWFDLPLPAPPRIVGALLVVTMTLGFLAPDYVFAVMGMSMGG